MIVNESAGQLIALVSLTNPVIMVSTWYRHKFQFQNPSYCSPKYSWQICKLYMPFFFFFSLENMTIILPPPKKKKSLQAKISSKNIYTAVPYLMEIRISPRRYDNIKE